MSHHSPTSNTLSTFLLVLLINQHTLNHHTLQQETCTHLRNTHLLPRSYDLIVHIIPTSLHTSTLELQFNNKVAKVTIVALQLCFRVTYVLWEAWKWDSVQYCDENDMLWLQLFSLCHISSLVPRLPPFLPSIYVHNNTPERKTSEKHWSYHSVYYYERKWKIKMGEAWGTMFL